ncbi:MAG TPA: 23S rRNA (adenine(2030)-N(6))-methyltransferase RlmJ [Kiloniellales bacterium]|nr:23S rRNA (adenine(2030)-N(6))-methyltransferase RlmJ [Kiloniellales bacterium]
MNYRHAFHAANFADVVKHAALALLVERLQAKQGALAFLDLFAGPGVYDLEGEAARKTGEAEAGLFRLWPPPKGELGGLLKPWLDHVAALNGGRGTSRPKLYPGSPELLRRLLRPQDRLVLAELHEADGAALRRRYGQDGQVAVHRRDGFEALPALVPPPERRGLVLIDPPYEQLDEWDRLARALQRAYRRWPTGVYVVWYPVKDPSALVPWLGRLRQAVPRRLLQAELSLFDEQPAWRLNGCGLLLVNPPWRFVDTLEVLLRGLQPLLARSGGATRVAWLTGEDDQPGT